MTHTLFSVRPSSMSTGSPWKDFFTFAPDCSVTDFQRDRLERYIRTFLGEGLHTIEGSPITGRLDWLSCLMLMTGHKAEHCGRASGDSIPTGSPHERRTSGQLTEQTLLSSTGV
jgi:hypothetical protein